MSRISETLASKAMCSFCGEETRQGGYWSGAVEIVVCSQCREKLIHLMWDTIFDTSHTPKWNDLDYHAVVDNWTETIQKIFWRKAYIIESRKNKQKE